MRSRIQDAGAAYRMRASGEVNVQGTAYCMRHVGQNRIQYAAPRKPGCEDHLAGLVYAEFHIQYADSA
jgi:hypothetical protein